MPLAIVTGYAADFAFKGCGHVLAVLITSSIDNLTNRESCLRQQLIDSVDPYALNLFRRRVSKQFLEEVLQEGELEHVGEECTRNVDVRIIAATNRNLKTEAEAGGFSEDLYYRLSVFPIELLPLRRRKEDIVLLAENLLGIQARRLGTPTVRLTRANVSQLESYDWPGNVRELQHVLERSLITSPLGKLKFDLRSADPGSVAAASSSTELLIRRVTTSQANRQDDSRGTQSNTRGIAPDLQSTRNLFRTLDNLEPCSIMQISRRIPKRRQAPTASDMHRFVERATVWQSTDGR